MKVLCIGDLHFNIKRLKNIDKLKSDIRDIVIENNIDIIVFLGDIIDTHKNIHMTVLNESVRFFSLLAKMKKNIYVLIGNHDRTNNQVFMTNEYAFYKCKIDNVTFVPKTYKMDNMLFVPYVPNGRFNEAISGVDLSDVKIIFAHQEFKGCMLNKHFISKDGDDITSELPMIISGHIHDYSELKKNDRLQVLYTGTPYQISINESHRKYYIIYDIETQNITKIRTKFDYVKVKEIDIKDIDDVKDEKDTKYVITGDIDDIISNKHRIKSNISNFSIKATRKINMTKGTYNDILYSLMSEKEKELYNNLDN